MGGRRIHVRLLGPVGLEADGVQISVPRGRGRSILALLALESPRAVAVDRFVEEAWNRRPPASAMPAVQVAVSRLRSAVGEDVIVTIPGGYRLGDVDLDVETFRQATHHGRRAEASGDHETAADHYRQALAVWRGEPLGGCADLPFIESSRRALQEERIAVVASLMDCELASGRHDSVVGELTGLVDRYPYREGLWSRLMLALYRSGRQADALAAFASFRGRLGGDLGLEPSADLYELEDRILTADASLDPPPEAKAKHRSGRRRVLEPGDPVFLQGDRSDAIYWIVDGTVAVVREPDTVITELGSGRYVGELGPLLGLARSASVRAVTRTELEELSVDAFRARVSGT